MSADPVQRTRLRIGTTVCSSKVTVSLAVVMADSHRRRHHQRRYRARTGHQANRRNVAGDRIRHPARTEVALTSRPTGPYQLNLAYSHSSSTAGPVTYQNRNVTPTVWATP